MTFYAMRARRHTKTRAPTTIVWTINELTFFTIRTFLILSGRVPYIEITADRAS